MAWVCAIVLLTSAAPAPEPYAWPLDLPRALTSSFGEFRWGRFHAGIDLRTGDIGKPVHAPADGYVSRVRCSPWGYGKVVYLQLADGRTAVLAHLDDFAPEIRDYVRAAQHERQRYTVDLYPPRDALPVRHGAIIAYSGQTGIGVPHLHYELRDRQGHPISPRLASVTWPDDTPPIIQGVLIVPDGPASTLNGAIAPLTLTPSRRPDGVYACAPIRATGRIGFGLDTLDPANGGASKLGVRTVRTTAGGVEIFRVQIDRFSYEDRRDETVSYHPFMMVQGRFLLQWRWPGNTCEPFAQFDGDGWFDVPESDTEIAITSTDYAGNQEAVIIPIRPGLPAPPPEIAGGGRGTGNVDLTCMGDWILATARFTHPEPTAPRLVALDAETQFHRVDALTFRAGLKPEPGARETILSVTHPRIPAYQRQFHIFERGGGDRTITEDPHGQGEPLKVTVRSNSPYGRLFLRIYPAKDVSTTPIPLRTQPVRLWPAAAPIDEPIEIAFPLPQGVLSPGRLAVYRDTGSGWSHLTTRQAGDRLIISTNALGAFAVLEDNQPPTIRDIVPAKDAAISGDRPTIRARIADTGSGIEAYRITCNGQWLLTAYDPERGTIEWEQDQDLPKAPRELRLTVTDAAGNTTTATRGF